MPVMVGYLENTMHADFWRKWGGIPIDETSETVDMMFVSAPSEETLETFRFLYNRRIVVHAGLDKQTFEQFIKKHARTTSFHEHSI